MNRDSKVFPLWFEARAALSSIPDRPKYRRWSSIGISGRGAESCVAVRLRTPAPSPALHQKVERQLRNTTNIRNVEIQHTGPVLSLPLREHAEAGDGVLRIGSSISLPNTRAGTLGFFARCRLSGLIGIVSANHVIGGQDRAQPGDAVLSPGGTAFGTRVATFVRSVPLSGDEEKYVDCAFATLDIERQIPYEPFALPNRREFQPKLAMPQQGQTVFKFSNGKETRGKISLADQDEFKMFYRSGIGLVRFDNQIEVESADANTRFSAAGDSGAVVYTDDLRPVGLLFANTMSGGTHGNGLSYLNRIDEVLNRLNVDLVS